MVSGFHSVDVIPVRVAAVGPAVGAVAGAAAAGAAALVAAAGGAAVVAAGGAAACCELRLLQASSSGRAARDPPAARLHFRNERRLTFEFLLFDMRTASNPLCDGFVAG